MADKEKHDLLTASTQLAIASWTIKLLVEREVDPEKTKELQYVEACVVECASYIEALRKKVLTLPEEHRSVFEGFTADELQDGYLTATQIALEHTHLYYQVSKGNIPKLN